MPLELPSDGDSTSPIILNDVSQIVAYAPVSRWGASDYCDIVLVSGVKLFVRLTPQKTQALVQDYIMSKL